MKRVLSIVLALVMLFGLSSVAFADDLGVQLIGGPTEESEPVNLDDIKLKTEIEIERWGTLTATECTVVDTYRRVDRGYSSSSSTVTSGVEADYLMLRMDILNTTLKEKDYLEDYSVKVVYDDVYEYAGWARQYDYNNYNGGEEGRKYPMHPDDNFAISPMYAGHYVFGCTLPNAVINSKKPLRMIITIDGNEITYNVRK